MDNFVLILIGVFIGVFSYDQYLKYLNKQFIIKYYKQPLLELEKKGLDIYTFSYRQGDYVMLSFEINNQIFIDLKKRSLAVYHNNIFSFNTHEKLNKDFDRFYIKLLTKFHKEIYEDVIKVNNIVYSRNVFHPNIIAALENETPKQNIESFLSVDTILDKMNESGFNSLTEEEKNFLKNKSEE